jgi:membrane-associated phospholipid phosphatase
LLCVLARLDRRLLYTMRTRFHGKGAETVAKTLALVGEYGAIWMVIGGALALADLGRRGQWLIAGALGPVAIGLNFAVKVVVRRRRPVLEGLPPLGRAPSSLSFPSAHTTSSFASAVAMTRIDPTAGALFALVIPIALGRPYLGMHYPSDVLGGALLGTALGLLMPLS